MRLGDFSCILTETRDLEGIEPNPQKVLRQLAK